MGSLANLIGVTTTTTGTGAVALGAALTGHRTFVAAAIANGTVVSYSIRDVATGAREVGQGTVSGTGTSMTRVLEDSTTGALLNLSGNAEVYVSSLASDAFSDGRVRSALLSGVDTPITYTPIDSTDAVLTGFRKLIAWVSGKSQAPVVTAPTGSVTLTFSNSGATYNTASTSRQFTVSAGIATGFDAVYVDGPSTWVAASGVTITESRQTGQSYSVCMLVQTGTNTFRLVGTTA